MPETIYVCDSLEAEYDNWIYVDQKDQSSETDFTLNLIKDNIIKPLYSLNKTLLIEINYYIDPSIKNNIIIKCIKNNLTTWTQAFYYIGIDIMFIESYNPSRYNIVFKCGINTFPDQKINLTNNRNDVIINFNSLVEWSDDKLYSNIFISNIISHNLGHIFGLYHDDINESIMYKDFDYNDLDIEKHINLENLRETYRI